MTLRAIKAFARAHDKIHAVQRRLLQAEHFADGALDIVARHGALGGAFAHHQPKPGRQTAIGPGVHLKPALAAAVAQTKNG